MSLLKKIKIRWYSKGGYREFLVIAIPLILSTSSLSLQEFVDRMFLTWYSPEAVAAALPAGVLHLAIAGLFIGTASYTGTFVAQYYGAGMHHRIGSAVWQGIYFSIIGSIALAFLVPIAPKIFALAGHEQLVQKYETIFFQILCLGSFPIIVSVALAGFFSGLGRTWPIMYINILSTIVTIILDFCLIFGKFGFPAMGIKGAGIATVISAICSVTCYTALILRTSESQKYNTRINWHFEFNLFKRLIRYGLPSGVQFFIDLCGFALFILLVGKLGTINLAATNIAFNINTIAFMPMIGAGISVSVLVGQYIGAGETEFAEKSTYSSFHITFIYMSIIALLFLLCPEVFVTIFTSSKHLQEMAIITPIIIVLLRFVSFYSLFDSASIIFSFAIRGAGDTFFVMIAITVLSMLGLAFPTYIAISFFHAGLLTCWIITTIYFSLSGLVFYMRFKSGKWKYMRVIESKSEKNMTRCLEHYFRNYHSS